jgi:hypothetical protein
VQMDPSFDPSEALPVHIDQTKLANCPVCRMAFRFRNKFEQCPCCGKLLLARDIPEAPNLHDNSADVNALLSSYRVVP